MPLLLLFVIMPVLEMWVLIEVGSKIGALTTIGLVLLTAMLGLALLRQQGISTVMRANQRMQSGQLPAQEMVEGIFLAVGGALLLTPGFVTDAIGFACLIPGLRHLIIGRLLKKAIFRATAGGAGFHQSSQGFRASRPADDDIIEGEYRQDNPTHDHHKLK
ncbi:MAG: FxsA family protein [Cellvibrionaceae bacterium]